jgi:hypothetical protein
MAMRPGWQTTGRGDKQKRKRQLNKPKQVTLEQIKARFPNASAAFIRHNLTGCEPGSPRLPASKPEPDSRGPLDNSLPGEKTGRTVLARCAFIRFNVYSTQPRDWDNSWTKPLQDLLVEIGLLDSDDWKWLTGIVVPHKVKKKNQERTKIEIWYQPP